jgi:hypothetical protein
MGTTRDILDSIETRLRELSDEIDRLTAARAALDGPALPAAKPPRPAAVRDPVRKRSPARAKRRRSNRQAAVVGEGALEEALSSTEGLSTSALAERVGANPTQVLGLLRDMEKTDRVRRTGHARATRWHVVSEEQRIEERAAELAARSASAT